MFRFCKCSVLFVLFFSLNFLSANTTSNYGKLDEDVLDYTLGVSYTYWYPFQDGLRGFIDVNKTLEEYASGAGELSTAVIYPKICGRSGFKLFGNFKVNDGWDFFLGYTWFYNKDNRYMTAPPTSEVTEGGRLFAAWPLDSLVGLDGSQNDRIYKRQAALAWNNAFNRIDFTFGKMLFGDDAFNFSPFFGLVAAWDDQEYEASFAWINTSNTAELTEWVVYQDWWGVGPSVGLAPIYNVWVSDDMDSSVYLYARGDAVVAWSQVNLLATQYIQMTSNMPIDRSDPTQLSARYRDLVNTIAPAMDISLGGCWKIMFDEMVGLDLTLGWDLSVWFAHAYIANPVRSSSGRGLYSMQGLTASFALRF